MPDALPGRRFLADINKNECCLAKMKGMVLQAHRDIGCGRDVVDSDIRIVSR
jgi:hypothetical protein